MTATARPNLGGLFNGSTPPERSSGIADAIGPRRIALAPTVDEADSRSTETETETGAGTEQVTPDAPGVSDQSPDSGPRRAPLEWIDPVKAVEHYFAFLQAVLDANREVAVALAGMVRSLPGYARSRR
jgi:hypothetical protein